MNARMRSICWTTGPSTQLVENEEASMSPTQARRRKPYFLIFLLAVVGPGSSAFGHEDEKNPVLVKGKAPETAEIGPWEGDLIFDFEFPQSKRQEFKSGCVEEHIAIGFVTAAGHRVWCVPKEHWPKAHRLAQRLQIPTITPLEGIPVGDSICLVSAPAFQSGHWDAAFDAALDTLRHTDSESDEPEDLSRELTPQERSIPDARHTLQECHLRSVNEAKGLRLPTIREWIQIKQSSSRMDQIAYLGDRISLSKGVVNENGLIVPRCIPDVSRRRELGEADPNKNDWDDQPIEPFLELLKLNILKSEVAQLYPYFAINWTFLPDGDVVAAEELRLHASSRYCLCVVINHAFQRRNAIREYDLTDDDWQDVEMIAALVQRKCIDLPRDDID